MPSHLHWKRESLELRNLILFFVIAFGWSWAIWFGLMNNWIPLPQGIGTPDVNLVELAKVFPMLILSPFGPTIAAFLMTFFTEGRAGVKQL